MSHPNPAGNGCSLEDCYTNLFALTDLCGIKWRKLNADNVIVEPLDDPVLDSYSRCIQADILCVWRRVLRNPEQRLTDHLAYSKELWIFWYGDEPLSLDTLLSPNLKEIDKGCWDKDKDKDKDNGLSYECRTLLFKALHNLIERCLLTKNFIRLGKWFVQPYDQNSSSDRSSHLSFCFHFFLHGESSVCASIEIKQHPPVWRLTPQHLTLVQESTSPLQVILAPYGLSATLTGNTYRDTDQTTRVLLDEWSRYYPGEVIDAKDASGENLNKLPSMVEVIIAGTRMRYPSAFIFTCEEEPTLTVAASTLSTAPVPQIQRPPCPHPVIPNGPLTPPTSPGEPQLLPGSTLKLCPSLSYATGPVEPCIGLLDQTADSLAFRILEKVAQDSVTMAGMSKRNADLSPEDMLLTWDFGDPTTKVTCNCIRHRNSKSKSGAQAASKGLLQCAGNKHVKGEKSEKLERQMARHSRSVLAFHRRTTQHDELFHFELDMIPPMPPNPAFRPPPNSSSSSSGASGVAPGLPQLHNTVEPNGSGGVDSPSTPAPSPLDSESRNQPLINQNMDPAMPTLSPHPPPQKSGPDKDIGGGGGGGGGGSIGGGGGGGNSSGGGGSGASSGSGAGGSGSSSKPASIGESQNNILFNGNDLYCNTEPSPKMEAAPSPATLQQQQQVQQPHHQQQQQQQHHHQQQQQQQDFKAETDFNCWLRSQQRHGESKLLKRPVLPTNEVEDEQTLVTDSLYDFQSLNSWFDNRLKRPKFESRQDSQHFHQQQQLQHNSHFSQHPQNSSSNKQPSKPCTSQPPRDPYEFTDDESSVFGTLPARNFRTSRDDLFRSSPIKEEEKDASRLNGNNMTSVGSPPASCSLPVSNSLTTEKDLFPTPMDLDHIFESEDSSDETFQDQQIPNQKSGDENHKGSKGSNIISNGTIAASELSRMYPTPPSLENPVSSPGTVTDIAPETTMTPDSCVKTEVDNSTIINDSSKDWSCVFKPPKLARFVGSTKYAPVELPSAHDTLSNFQIPEYKPSWQYQSHAPSHYLNLPSIENIPSLSKMHVGAIESSPATFPGGSVSRTPMSYEQSPMSNASSSYVNKTLSSIDNQGTNHQLPEVHSVLVNVILGDSSLNIFKDHNFDSCNLCVCNMRVKDDDFNVEDMNRCTCGFSAVMNRMFGHNSGLFYEDEVDITGIKDDRYDQNTHKRLAVIDYQKTGINKDNATNQTALVPEDVPQDILECLLSQFCVPFPSSVAMRMFSKLITNAATSLVDNVVNGISMQDGNEAAYSALEQGRQAAENCSPSKLDDPLMKSSCLHRWPYLQGANRIPLNSQDVLRLLKSLQPLLSDAIQKKRTMRLWEHTYKLSGPLSWKDFHQLAGRGTEENSEPQPIPSFLVGYDKDWLSVSPYALPYWDKLLLEPYGKTRDVAYVVVCPDNEYIFRNVKFFFKELSTVYELCRLGRHSPITKVLRDGILKVGKAASQKYAEESIEGWFNYIGESPVAAKLRLYAKICRYHLGPHLAQQTLDKSLFEACSSKSGHSTPRPSDISQAPATPENQSNSTANSVSGNLSSTQGGSQPATQPQQPQQQQAPMTSGSTTSSSGTSSSGTANTTSSQSANNNSDEANKDGAGGDGNAQREGGLHEQSQESEDSTAECPALVVYMVDPFTYSQEWDHLNRLAMIGLLHCYQELVKTLPEQMQNHVSLQIIPLETVIDQKESGSQYQMLKSLAFSVFTACRWNLMHTVLGRSLTGFGPAAEAELFLKQKEADKAGPLKLYCPPFILAPVKDKQSTLAESCGEKLEKSTIVFCGYCLSEDQRWLLAACTDERGEMKETCIINIEIPNRNRRKKASARKAGLQKLWTFIVGIVSVTTLPCRLVIGRFGRLGHGELKGWAELLGKKNLMKASQQMRDMCTQCSIMSSSETPCILSACLVSMEPQSSFRILVDSIKVEEKMSSNCPLQTPRDASCTHILVFPTSATAQASNHSLHRGEHAMDATYHLGDLGPDALFPHDAIGDAMGDAIGDDMDDLLSIFMNPLPDDKTSAPGSLIHGDEGCQSPSKMGVPSAGAGTTTNDLQEEGGTLLQQPLAMGYYVSTASTGPLPKWFWSSCPEAENVCPNILKAALHTHSSSKQDDPLPLQSTHSRNIHPLDSNLTCDVLRFVLENYNALSWLTMDPVKNDRRSCLPVHFVMLMQMYHAINAYV